MVPSVFEGKIPLRNSQKYKTLLYLPIFWEDFFHFRKIIFRKQQSLVTIQPILYRRLLDIREGLKRPKV